MRSKIVYSSDRAQVIHGDAADYLPHLATESVDLVVTDPPYGAEWRSNQRAERFDILDGDQATPEARDAIKNVLTQCVRIVGQSRHLYVFGPDDVIAGLKVSKPATLIWDKGTLGSGNTSLVWAPAHEPITFVVSKHRHGGKAGAETVPARLRRGTVLRHTRPTGRKVRHPSEKPVTLIRELIESSSRPDDVILDPYAGSGPTGVAAILLGRRALLIDTNRDWCDLAAQRIRDAETLHNQARNL